MRYFLENRISAFMIFAGLFLLGAISIPKLPVSLMPQVIYPGISVIIEYPGISPEKIEKIITKPIEKIIKTVPGIQKINSISEEGKSRININFQMESDIKISALKVREKIALIRDYFPGEVQEPMVLRYDPSNKPVLIATAKFKDFPLHEIRELVERKIKPKIQRIEGVSEINIVGGSQKEIHIDVDQKQYESKALTLQTINQIIQQNNISLPGGSIAYGNKEFNVYSAAKYKDISEIANLPILSTSQGSLIKLYDISDVIFSFKDKEDIARLNGKEEVVIYIHKAGEANTLSVCNNALELFNELSNFEIDIIYNQSEYIQTAIDNVVSSCLWGSIIVILVLFFFLRKLHIVLTIGLSIPVSIVIVFMLMFFFGFELNVISLSGLALGAGMIVDNCIVITESIFHHKKVNLKTMEKSISKVNKAIVSSTFTTIAVFFPIVFGNISTKKMYGGLAFTVSSALFISLCVSIILVPAVYTIFVEKPHYESHFHEIVEKIKLHIKKFINVITFNHEIGEITIHILRNFEDLMLKEYHKIFDKSFKNKKKVLVILCILIGLTILLKPFIKAEYVDPISSNEFYIYLEFPTGTSLSYTEKAVLISEEKVNSMNIAKKVSTKIEKWRGTLTVQLKEEITSDDEISKIKKGIKKDLNNILKSYNGYAFISEASEVSEKELNIAIVGNDNKELRNLAKTVASHINKIPSIEECVLRFREGRPEYHITIDKDKANSLGLTPYDIATFFRTTIFGPVITKFVDKDKEIDVRLRYREKQRDTINKIQNYYIKNKSGELIPIKELVKINSKIGPTKIWRQNGRRNVTITAKIGQMSYNDAIRVIDQTLEPVKFPEEYYYEYDDNIKRMQKNQKSMIITIIMSIIFIYMILASLFESFRLPLIIMFTVPLAIIGVMFAIFLTNSSLNISVYIGLIVLTGIVVNNGIILVDSINYGYTHGEMTQKNIVKYIRQVCSYRLRPICITTITTILGLFPMLVNTGKGSNLWQPLSLTVISGLLFSTLLTLIIIPTLCYFLYNSLLKMNKKPKKI